MPYIHLDNRGVLKLSGPDAKSFLQGLITNDINLLQKDKAIYTLMLNAKGKFLYDFFLLQQKDELLLEYPLLNRQEIIKKFKTYKTRAKVHMYDTSYKVFSLLDKQSELIELSFIDPRDENMGIRLFSKESLQPLMDIKEYEKRRINLCIPEGNKDILPETALPFEYDMQRLQCFSFNKGCYLGQEVVAHVTHRGVIRKTLCRVTSTTTLPPLGSKLTTRDNTVIGKMCSSVDDMGLAVLRRDIIEKDRVVFFDSMQKIVILAN